MYEASEVVNLAKCFNLSILECKWNNRTDCDAGGTVLIYPYWNVNSRGAQAAQCGAGFNLSILECK